MYTFTSEVIILLAFVVQSHAEASHRLQDRVEAVHDVKKLLVELAANLNSKPESDLGERKLKAWRPQLHNSADLDHTMLGKGKLRMYERVYIPECGTSSSCAEYMDPKCCRMNLAVPGGFQIVNETTRETWQNVDEELRNFEAYVLGPEGLFERWLERLVQEKERLVMIRGSLIQRRNILDNLKQVKAYSQNAIGQPNDSTSFHEVAPVDRLQRLERIEHLLQMALDSPSHREHSQPPSTPRSFASRPPSTPSSFASGPRSFASSSMSVASYLEKVPLNTTGILAAALVGLFAGGTGVGFSLLHVRRPGVRGAGEDTLLVAV